MDSNLRRSSAIERWAIRRALRRVGSPRLDVVLWDGARVLAAEEPPVARVVIRSPVMLRRLAWNPHLQFGDGYASGQIEVHGDLTEAMCEISRATQAAAAPRRKAFRRSRKSGASVARARSNVSHHYDLGNDFYALWLDRELLYTCAYFERAGMSLEDAQRAKMDHVCRKLRLQPGERVIEAGCGWGALALHMAKNYGVQVRACNVSREQIHYARDRARREGLADRVEFIEDDWRSLAGECDAFVSVGMLEHVGIGQFDRMGRVLDRCLTPAGRGLLHFIGKDWPLPLQPWIEREIFPGAEPPTLAESMQIFEPYGMTVLDVENLRLHYAETLQHWLGRFEQSVDQVRRMFDERFVRIWRMYLAGSIAAFRTGGMQLFQVVFNRSTSNAIPRTREYQYACGEFSDCGLFGNSDVSGELLSGNGHTGKLRPGASAGDSLHGVNGHTAEAGGHGTL